MSKSGEFELNSEISGEIPEGEIVTAVCTSDNSKTLFVNSEKDGRGWELPTGRIESGETPREAVQRELKEEANALVSNVECTEELDISTPEETIKQYIFEVEILNESELKPGNENCEIEFLDSPPEPVSFGNAGKKITNKILSN
jgi:mutator protein MutT